MPNLDKYALRELREMQEACNKMLSKGNTDMLLLPEWYEEKMSIGDILEIALDAINNELELRKIQEEGRNKI